MNQKQAKRARIAANMEAVRQDVWGKGEKSVYAKWYRKLLAKIFPKFRKKYADWVGRWYKKVLKSFAKQHFARIHDQEYQAFLRASKKVAKIERRRRMERISKGQMA